MVFNRDGFHNCRLSEIPATARLSTGTFYNYFDSKEEVFHAVMEVVLAELQSNADSAPIRSAHLSPADSIRRANRRYLTVYRGNERLMADCTTLASTNAEIMGVKQKIDQVFEKRLVKAITQWQQSGQAAADIDPVYAANALAYMVDRFAHEFYFVGKNYDEEKAIDVLSKLWIRALGIEEATSDATTVGSST